MREALAKVRREIREEFTPAQLRAELEVARTRIDAYTFDRYLSQIDEADIDPDRREELIALGRLDPGEEPVVKEWEEENRELFGSIIALHLEGVEKAIRGSAEQARTLGKVQADVRERYGMVRRRARTIADDQAEKLAGRIDGARQTAVGVSRYRWRTMMDDRVRPEHQAREGQTFEWSNPPSDGHPGEPPLCRCAAEPVWE